MAARVVLKDKQKQAVKVTKAVTRLQSFLPVPLTSGLIEWYRRKAKLKGI